MGRGPARAAAINKDLAVYDLSLVPWAGVAIQIANSTETPDVTDRVPVPCAGHVFVFLPLPVPTGLPVHINGFFELSENRRDLWYADSGMTGGGTKNFPPGYSFNISSPQAL